MTRFEGFKQSSKKFFSLLYYKIYGRILIFITIIIIFWILFIFSIPQYSTISSSGFILQGETDKIDIMNCSFYTEHSERTDDNVSLKLEKNFNYNILNTQRYILNSTVRNIANKSLYNLNIEIRFFDINKIYLFSKSYIISHLPKNYEKNITVNFTSKDDYFNKVHQNNTIFRVYMIL